jgi:hypothetical protein
LPDTPNPVAYRVYELAIFPVLVALSATTRPPHTHHRPVEAGQVPAMPAYAQRGWPLRRHGPSRPPPTVPWADLPPPQAPPVGQSWPPAPWPPAVPLPPPPRRSPWDDFTAQLVLLAALHDSGKLSDDEFTEAKARLLNPH